MTSTIRSLALFLGLLAPSASLAATISIGPSDSFDKIEAAKAGDEVVIAPGSYNYRVHLTKAGTADQPIVIRAQDPTNPPMWDLDGTLVEDAPGSYAAGDRGRGCWQISGGANYQISGVVFANCHNAGRNSAGLRYYNGARGIRLRDCVFRGNDNGLTGGTGDSEITVEYSEFDRNGNTAASAPTHNIYVYGGDFTLRYSYVHDPLQGQNFHIRASTSVIEYNWFARAKSYEGDLMSSDDLSGVSAVRQVMLLRGNVLLQNAQPGNNAQVMAVYNDGEVAGLSFSIRLVNNTFVGNGGHAALVHLSNADGTAMSAELVNNIVSGTSVATLVEDADTASVSGTNNWVATGASVDGLDASITGADPGFADESAKDFTLAPGSQAIGKAAVAADLPQSEYYRDEQMARLSRQRTTAIDLGAFESTTHSAPSGPYGPVSTSPVDAAADAGPVIVPVIDATAGSGGSDAAAGTGGNGGAGGARSDASITSDGTGGGTGTGGAITRPDAGLSSGGASGSGGMSNVDATRPTVDAEPLQTGGVRGTGGVSGDASSGVGGSTKPASSGSGCGCDLARPASPRAPWVLCLVALACTWRRRRSRRGRRGAPC